MSESAPKISPPWSSTTKLVVMLTITAAIIGLVLRFQYIIGPLLLAFVLAYLIHPLAALISRRSHIPWKVTVTVLYLILLVAIFGLLTWGGISLVNELQNLVGFLQNLVENFPNWLKNFTAHPLVIGPFSFDISTLNATNLWTQLQSILQPLLANVATVIATIATGAATFVTWTVFTILISYFISSETGGTRTRLINLKIPAYQEDLNKIGYQLSHIWNAFLRGQMIVFVITVIWYTILLGSLGVNYFFGLAILAGLARFVPYVGPFVAWTTYALVALFQAGNYFNLLPFPFALVIVGSALISDVVMDNFVSPRVMSNALEVHPAAVLVTVLVAASLFGFIGVLLAAPVLASLKLVLNYLIRKLMDMDPWEGLKTYPEPIPLKTQLSLIAKRIGAFFVTIYRSIRKLIALLKKDPSKKNESNKSKEI